MILHVLNASPSSSAFRECVGVIQPGDALLLIGDGVYAAMEGTAARDLMLERGVDVHMLRSDASAAGVTLQASDIQVIDMDDFVALTERFSRQQTWY